MSQTASYTTETPTEPPARVGVGFLIVLALAYMGIFLGLLTPVIVTMALKLTGFGKGSLSGHLSLVLGVGALFALIGNPLFGKLSDRTTSRLGRRRPWLIGGVLGALVGLAVVATASSVALVLVGWSIAQISFNAALAALIAVLPDQVPVSQRGLASAFLGVGIPVAAIVGTYIVAGVHGMFLKFLVPGLIAAALVLLLVAVLPDKRIAKGSMPKYSVGEFARSFYVNPRKTPDFSWAWLSRFLLFMGLSFLLTYQVPYLLDHLHVADSRIGDLVFRATLVQSAVLIVVSFIAGPISDRIRRRKAFVLVASVIYAAGLAVIAFAPTYGTFLVGMAITGAGQGIYIAVDLALVTDVLPSPETAARDLGVFNIASAGPQSLAPSVAPVFLAIAGPANFVSLFGAAAIFAGVGALAIIPIRKVR
jgi:MFS family permease